MPDPLIAACLVFFFISLLILAWALFLLSGKISEIENQRYLEQKYRKYLYKKYDAQD